MKNLNHFIYKVENYIKNNGLQDVIELTPLFEELELPDWKSLVDTKSGRPSTTTVIPIRLCENTDYLLGCQTTKLNTWT